jgi:flagellin-like protein
MRAASNVIASILLVLVVIAAAYIASRVFVSYISTPEARGIYAIVAHESYEGLKTIALGTCSGVAHIYKVSIIVRVMHGGNDSFSVAVTPIDRNNIGLCIASIMPENPVAISNRETEITVILGTIIKAEIGSIGTLKITATGNTTMETYINI